MTLQALSTLFIAFISLWAMWCMLSSRVRDGIIGKVIYAAIMVSGFAIVTRAETVFVTPTTAGVTFHGAIAMSCLRHWFVANHWPVVKAWLCRYLHCEQCLSDESPRK